MSPINLGLFGGLVSYIYSGISGEKINVNLKILKLNSYQNHVQYQFK